MRTETEHMRNTIYPRYLLCSWAIILVLAVAPKAVDAGDYSAGWTRMVQTPNGILYYNATTGADAVGRVDAAGNHVTIKSYLPGSFAGWTQVVNTQNGILYYNTNTGAGAVGRIDAAGDHKAIKFYPPGSLATGWTSVMNAPGGIHYYNAKTGGGAVGRIDVAGDHVTIK